MRESNPISKSRYLKLKYHAVRWWRTRGKPNYYRNPQHYWDQRHRVSHASLAGIGCSGLDETNNLADYQEKWLRTESLLRSLPLQQGHRFLDAGCGTGFFATRLQSLGFKVEGLDFSPQAITVARQQGPPEIVYHVGDLDTFAPLKRYDAVLCVDVLFHITDDVVWQRALDTLQNLVFDSGFLIVQEELSNTTTRQLRDGRTHVKRRTLRDYTGTLPGWQLLHHETYSLPQQGTSKDLLCFSK